MKLLNIIGFAAAVLSCVPFVGAQEAGDKAKVRAYVHLPKQKNPTLLELDSASGKNKFRFIVPRSGDQKMEATVGSCSLFLIQTPADLAEGMNEYREGDLSACRKRMAHCRKKYEHYLGLPGNPAAIAALYELKAAVRQMDWAAAGALAGSFPADDPAMSAYDVATARVAAVMGGIAQNGGDLAAVEALLADKNLLKSVNAEVYGWLCYAKARALEAKVPADQIKGGLSGDAVKTASQAVDAYCQCVVSHHSIATELPKDALRRALPMLWAMPGVREYSKRVHTPVDAKGWNGAPADFRDAVAMAQLMKTVYDPETKNELVDSLARLHYNTAKDRKKDKKAAGPAKK